jgi:hypothetical protein
MKKLIVAAAGLMLAVPMVQTASADAGVTFGGDARARGFYLQDYNLVDSDTSNWNSRVRLKVRGESKGGAYAIARVRLADARWDGAQDQSKGAAQGSNIYTDYAYLGTPLGSSFTVDAGLMPFNITTFSVWDTRTDAVNINYNSDMTILTAFYNKQDEVEEASFVRTLLPGADIDGPFLVDTSADLRDDNDTDRYGILLNQKFDGGWGLVAAVWYQDDQQVADLTGAAVAAELKGTIGTVGVLGTAAWAEGDLVALPDDPWGVYGQAAIPMGAVSLAAGVGYTADGFVADGDFGPFIMLSDVSNIATGIRIGTGGDTLFGALVPSIAVNEQLTLTGVVAYADIDGLVVDSAFEVSGRAAYVVVEGATLSAEAGYLDVDGAPEPAIGAGVILDVSF